MSEVASRSSEPKAPAYERLVAVLRGADGLAVGSLESLRTHGALRREMGTCLRREGLSTSHAEIVLASVVLAPTPPRHSNGSGADRLFPGGRDE